MMKFKKFLAAAMTGAMMLGTVATVAPAVNAYAEEQAKASASYSFPLKDGTAEIDLSFLGLGKPCAVQVRGDADNFELASAPITIKGQEKKPKFKYAPQPTSDTDLTISVEKSFGIGTGEAKDKVDDYQFKTLYGSAWDSLTNFDLVTASVAGTTIIIRKAAVTTEGNEALAGAEVKVKVAAAPKAPKVKVDYKKGLVTLPKASEVMVLYTATGETVAQAGTAASMTVVKHTSTKVITTSKDSTTIGSPAEILTLCGIASEQQADILANGFIIAVRTPANYSKKKAASSMAFVTIDAAETPGTADRKVTVKNGTFSWKLADEKYDFSAEGTGFEFIISDKAPDASARWTAVASGRSVKKAAAEIANKKIFVREAGDSNAAKLPSNAVEIVVKEEGTTYYTRAEQTEATK